MNDIIDEPAQDLKPQPLLSNAITLPLSSASWLFNPSQLAYIHNITYNNIFVYVQSLNLSHLCLIPKCLNIYYLCYQDMTYGCHDTLFSIVPRNYGNYINMTIWTWYTAWSDWYHMWYNKSLQNDILNHIVPWLYPRYVLMI